MADGIDNAPTRGQWEQIGFHHHHGIAIPLFSLHSKASCGIGEYLDLIPLIHWCRDVGMDVIQLLPLNDSGDDASPYSNLSACALNPVYISLSALPHMEEMAGEALSELRHRCRSQRVAYHEIRKEKLALLSHYFEQFGAEEINQADYRRYVEENGWVEGYARYLEFNGGETTFYSWVQYLCHIQLLAAAQEARRHAVLLMGDLPILISRISADVWSHPDLFDTRFSAGAPPDQYSSTGQNWGFPIYRWEAHFQTDFAWWRQRLAMASRYYQIFRLDHIVGFFRIWAIPPGKSGEEGLFLPSELDEQMRQGEAILNHLIASTSMLPIGEDLGIVPTEVRHLMERLGVCGTKVMRWEREWEVEGKPFIAGNAYPEMSLTTVSTHDSEPLLLWWRENPDEAMAYAEARGWSYQPHLSHDQLYEILAESHSTSSLFHVNLLQEYLALFPELIWGGPEDERINIPGTLSPSNWSYRFYPSVEELSAHEGLKSAIRKLVQ
jgi:4-alpha-glucanotransferase